jgi:hypothetical protein
MDAVQLPTMSEASSFGNLNSAYRFHIINPMNITSSSDAYVYNGNINSNTYNNNNNFHNDNNNVMYEYSDPPQEILTQKITHIKPTPVKNRVMIKHLSIPSRTYIWAVPSHRNGAYVRLRATYPKTNGIPLINSNSVRLFLQGIFSGVTYIPDVYPGDPLKLDLFVDKSIHISYIDTLRQIGTTSEIKTTSWISSDKQKYLTRTEEYVISARSSHTQPVFIILAESIPFPTDDQIKSEILSPKLTRDGDWFDDERFVGAMVDNAYSSTTKTDNNDDDIITYSKNTGTIFFMKWLKPNEEFKVNLKYKYTWPDGKNIVIY